MWYSFLEEKLFNDDFYIFESNFILWELEIKLFSKHDQIYWWENNKYVIFKLYLNIYIYIFE